MDKTAGHPNGKANLQKNTEIIFKWKMWKADLAVQLKNKQNSARSENIDWKRTL